MEMLMQWNGIESQCNGITFQWNLMLKWTKHIPMQSNVESRWLWICLVQRKIMPVINAMLNSEFFGCAFHHSFNEM